RGRRLFAQPISPARCESETGRQRSSKKAQGSAPGPKKPRGYRTAAAASGTLKRTGVCSRSGCSEELRIVDARQEGGPRGAKVANDCLLVFRAGQQRFPTVKVRGVVEVAACDRREAPLGDPAEEVASVEQLPAVDLRSQFFPVAGEAL